MNVEIFLQELDDIAPNIVDDGDKINWINELEDHMYSNIIEEQKSTYIDTVKDQESYDLPGIKLNDILKVIVGNIEYKKMTLSENEPNSYFQDGMKLGLSPVPTNDVIQGIKLIHRNKPTLKTRDTSATDELSIVKDYGIRFKNLYKYYVLWSISIENKEFGEANNYSVLYNEALGEFTGWYYKNLPNTTAIKRKRSWR